MVYLVIERAAVTIAFFALFGLAMLTNHLTGSIETIFAAGMGAALAFWFSGHSASVTAVTAATTVAAQQAAQVDAAAAFK